MLHERFAFTVETIWVSWLCVDNFPINVHGVVVLEWRVTSKHFVQKDAYSPPINGFPVTLVEQDFRGNILGSTTNGVCSLCNDLSETEINHLEVTISPNHNILRFEIPIDDV